MKDSFQGIYRNAFSWGSTEMQKIILSLVLDSCSKFTDVEVLVNFSSLVYKLRQKTLERNWNSSGSQMRQAAFQ